MASGYQFMGRFRGALLRLAALTNGQIIVGQTGAAPLPKTVSGDATLSAAGALTIGAKKITYAKAAVFVSPERTATGAEETIAHGLAAAPSHVLIVPTELAAGLAAGYDAAEGVHTSTNVLCTVTAGAKFKIMAWA